MTCCCYGNFCPQKILSCAPAQLPVHSAEQFPRVHEYISVFPFTADGFNGIVPNSFSTLSFFFPFKTSIHITIDLNYLKITFTPGQNCRELWYWKRFSSPFFMLLAVYRWPSLLSVIKDSVSQMDALFELAVKPHRSFCWLRASKSEPSCAPLKKFI